MENAAFTDIKLQFMIAARLSYIVQGLFSYSMFQFNLVKCLMVIQGSTQLPIATKNHDYFFLLTAYF